MNDSDSDDDYSGLQRQALPVELPQDFDPSAIPQNGEEFLHHVIHETSKCEWSTYAEIDKKKIKKIMIPSTMLHPQEDLFKTVPSSNLPSEDWQQRKLADFNKLRKFVAMKRNTVFTEHDSTPTKELLRGLPKSSYLISSEQPKILRLLEELLNFIILSDVHHLDTSDNLFYIQHLWIYGLLACLEIPLCPDTCHLLRQIAINCMRKRSQLEENCAQPELPYYNLIICIIGQYFNQKDLADTSI